MWRSGVNLRLRIIFSLRGRFFGGGGRTGGVSRDTFLQSMVSARSPPPPSPWFVGPETRRFELGCCPPALQHLQHQIL